MERLPYTSASLHYLPSVAEMSTIAQLVSKGSTKAVNLNVADTPHFHLAVPLRSRSSCYQHLSSASVSTPRPESMVYLCDSFWP
jgi:hypothetical protein